MSILLSERFGEDGGCVHVGSFCYEIVKTYPFWRVGEGLLVYLRPSGVVCDILGVQYQKYWVELSPIIKHQNRSTGFYSKQPVNENFM
jgi:hypothetical protein